MDLIFVLLLFRQCPYVSAVHRTEVRKLPPIARSIIGRF